jgi:hypothetical protein
MAILAGKPELMFTARRVKLWLPFAMFLVVLAGSVGMLLVLFRLAPSVEAFVYTLRKEVGVYLMICSVLAAVGTVPAYRAYTSGRCMKWLLLGVATTLVIADGVFAVLLAPSQGSVVRFLRYSPMLTPAHSILLLVVINYCWRGPAPEVAPADQGLPHGKGQGPTCLERH